MGGGLNGHNIFDRVSSLENVFAAWRQFRRGKRQKLAVRQFEFNLEDNLVQLHEAFASRQYKPLPYTVFTIQDPKLRRIHKAEVRDRVANQALFQVLYPIFDRYFIFDSYSSRFEKGVHAAVNRFAIFLRCVSKNDRHNAIVLKCDISKFFDSIDHDILIKLLERRITDQNVLELIRTVVFSFEKERGKGLPLGNVTSQLFANIYLNELDQFIKHVLKIKYYLRYSDDFVMVVNREDDLDILIGNVRCFLEDTLLLELHPMKIIIRRYSRGVDFLGFVLRPYHRTLRTKTKKRLLKRIEADNKNSYFGLLTHCNGYKIKKKSLKKLNRSP